VPVYEAFVGDYPTLGDAAREDPEALRLRLKPLGLEWRAENAVMFVREAHARYGDDLPADAESVRALPGAGDYVSAAVACFAGGRPVPLVDTNVVRVLGRVFGLRTDGEARRRKQMRELAAAAVDPEDPAAYHYALLDFAATVCKPRKPGCTACPLAEAVPCAYWRHDRVGAPCATG
jgi:A/G-specific adenine glycosylase